MIGVKTVWGSVLDGEKWREIQSGIEEQWCVYVHVLVCVRDVARVAADVVEQGVVR